MSINTTTSSLTTSTTTQVSNTQTSESTQKINSETSFKDEMEKVSSKQEKEVSEENTKNNETVNEKDDTKKISSEDKTDLSNVPVTENETDMTNLKFASLSMNSVNNQLTGDIAQMMNNADLNAVESVISSNSSNFDSSNSIFMTESDAQFFIELTHNEAINPQSVVAQAQTMLNSGAEVNNIKQNVNISQTLLDAIAKARDNNQPLRIDFDQNIAVILRISRDGVISANFIPGDKAVEQYLKDNLSSLRATFEEAELPYSDLSYSNRGSKQQKEQRRNN